MMDRPVFDFLHAAESVVPLSRREYLPYVLSLVDRARKSIRATVFPELTVAPSRAVLAGRLLYRTWPPWSGASRWTLPR